MFRNKAATDRSRHATKPHWCGKRKPTNRESSVTTVITAAVAPNQTAKQKSKIQDPSPSRSSFIKKPKNLILICTRFPSTCHSCLRYVESLMHSKDHIDATAEQYAVILYHNRHCSFLAVSKQTIVMPVTLRSDKKKYLQCAVQLQSSSKSSVRWQEVKMFLFFFV